MAHLHFTFLISTMQAEKAHRKTYFHKFVYGGGFLLSPLGFWWAGFVAKCTSHSSFATRYRRAVQQTFTLYKDERSHLYNWLRKWLGPQGFEEYFLFYFFYLFGTKSTWDFFYVPLHNFSL